MNDVQAGKPGTCGLARYFRMNSVVLLLALLGSAFSTAAQAVDNSQSGYPAADAGDWGGAGGAIQGPPDGTCANMGSVGKVNLVSSFGFNLPGNATITGVTTYTKAGENGPQSVNMQLATNAATDPPTAIGSVRTLSVLGTGGSCSDTTVVVVGTTLASWGNPVLTPAIVNASSFGLIFTKIQTSSIKVDSVCMQIDYTTPSGSATQTTCVAQTPLPLLALVKAVSNNFGGNNAASSWTLSANNGADPATSGPGGFTSTSVSVGTYTLSETPAANSAGYTAGNWVCTGTGGTFTPPDQIALVRGNNVSCTITNQDTAPGLTLNKTVNNTNGGNDLPASFALRLAGTDGTHNAGVNYASGATPTVKSNVQYTVTETPNSGYTLSSISCTNNMGGAVVGGLGSPFTLSEGQNVTCTYTNADITPALIVVKSVSGGDAVPADFVLHVTGAGGLCGQNGTADYASGASVAPVQANCAYTVSEDPAEGYTDQGVACVITGTATAVSHPVTLNEGQSVTCTLSNLFVPPGTLTVIKEVQNDDGGDALPSDFVLHITGDNGDAGDCGEDGTTTYYSGDKIDVDDICTYTVSEEALAGYSQVGGVVCVDANDGDAPVSHPVVDPTSDQAIVCTITNTDAGGMLALTKSVTNTGGGTAVAADWTLNAQGPTPKSGAGGFASTKVNVSDTYTLTETGGPDGYSASAWNCGNAQGQLSGNVLTINNGDNISCTITNTAIAPTLALTKVVVNNNEGTLTPGDFSLVLTGADGTNNAGVGYTSGATPTIKAGVNYTVSETAPEGYGLTSIVCVDTDTQVNLGSSFTATLDQNISCTVTNDDKAQAARFHVTKDFDDDNPQWVRAYISCNTGLPIKQDQWVKEGRDLVFIVESFESGAMDCTIYEDPVPAGYASSYSAGVEEDGVAGGISDDSAGCHFEEIEGGTFYCEILNEVQPVDVTVNKEWIIVGTGGDFIDPDYRLTLYCNGEIVGGENEDSYWSYLLYSGSSNGTADTPYAVDVYPDWDGSTYCWVDENVYDQSVEVSSDCGSQQSPGIHIGIGSGDSCTVTNTVFYEGIPTLSQYGMAILALLMLGMGLVGFRRFA